MIQPLDFFSVVGISPYSKDVYESYDESEFQQHQDKFKIVYYQCKFTFVTKPKKRGRFSSHVKREREPSKPIVFSLNHRISKTIGYVPLKNKAHRNSKIKNKHLKLHGRLISDVIPSMETKVMEEKVTSPLGSPQIKKEEEPESLKLNVNSNPIVDPNPVVKTELVDNPVQTNPDDFLNWMENWVYNT